MVGIINEGKLVILQSNDYIDVEEHVNCPKDTKCLVSLIHGTTLFEGTPRLREYRRFRKLIQVNLHYGNTN